MFKFRNSDQILLKVRNFRKKLEFLKRVQKSEKSSKFRKKFSFSNFLQEFEFGFKNSKYFNNFFRIFLNIFRIFLNISNFFRIFFFFRSICKWRRVITRQYPPPGIPQAFFDVLLVISISATPKTPGNFFLQFPITSITLCPKCHNVSEVSRISLAIDFISNTSLEALQW